MRCITSPNNVLCTIFVYDTDFYDGRRITKRKQAFCATLVKLPQGQIVPGHSQVHSSSPHRLNSQVRTWSALVRMHRNNAPPLARQIQRNSGEPHDLIFALRVAVA